MYNLHNLLVWGLILISTPVRMAAALPLSHIAEANAQEATTPYQLVLDITHEQAVRVVSHPLPNFDTDVLQPLRANQAAAAETARIAATRNVTLKKVAAPASGDILAQLRYCEAGGIYDRNSGNGYYGAYQYSISTWNNYGGYARADLAPAAVQDEKAMLDIARRGYSPWPACASRLGLL
jgi:hypothetical protein